MKNLTFNRHLIDDRLPLPEPLRYGSRAIVPLASGEPYRPPNCTPIGGDRPPEKREKYQSESSVNTHVVKLILEAIQQTDVWQFVLGLMRERAGSGSSLDEPPPKVESKPVGEEEERLAFSRRGQSVEKYRSARTKLLPANGAGRDDAERLLYSAQQADAVYRHSRQSISDRACRIAQIRHISYEEALDSLGADAPADLLPSSPV